MLLHNQLGAPLAWEAAGTTYSWEPYGACDVPEGYLPHLRLEGFPVALTPVVPKERARRAVEAQPKDESAAAVATLKADLEATRGKLAEAERAIEATEAKAREVAADAEAAVQRIAVLEQQLEVAKSENGEFEKLLAEAGAELTAAKGRIEVLEQQLQQQAKPPEPKKSKS